MVEEMDMFKTTAKPVKPEPQKPPEHPWSPYPPSDELDPPRWPGGPPICKTANLPAFTDRKVMAQFHSSLCLSPIETWRCHACKRFHGVCKPPSPSGSSSGTSRAYEIPKHIEELRAKAIRDDDLKGTP